MNVEDRVIFQRETAALLMAAMVTAMYPPAPTGIYDVADDAEQPPTEARILEVSRANAVKREKFERERSAERARLAMEAFAMAGALSNEAELWEGPQDEHGEAIDPRSLDRECIHGRKMSEPCAECDQRQSAADAGLPANSTTGEGTDANG